MIESEDDGRGVMGEHFFYYLAGIHGSLLHRPPEKLFAWEHAVLRIQKQDAGKNSFFPDIPSRGMINGAAREHPYWRK
jgi:hypothetical protein